MTNFSVAALVEKHHMYGLMHGHDQKKCVVCERTTAAIHEALEEAEKICEQVMKESTGARGDTAAAHCKADIAALRVGRH